MSDFYDVSITFWLTEELKTKVKAKCKQHHLNLSGYLREKLEEFVNADTDE